MQQSGPVVKGLTVAVTGHRSDKLGGYSDEVLVELSRLAETWLEEVKPTQVITGMAQGWDTAIALAAYKLNIPFVAAIPFKGQELRWDEKAQHTYHGLLGCALEAVTLSSIRIPGAYQIRNRWMVDHCDMLGALWNGSPGGTANCLRYADQVGRPWINLWDRWMPF